MTPGGNDTACTRCSSALSGTRSRQAGTTAGALRSPFSALRDPPPQRLDLPGVQRLALERHAQRGIGVGHALDQQAGVRVARHDGRCPPPGPRRGGKLERVEAQPRLALARVEAVARETPAREDRADVAAEGDGVGRIADAPLDVVRRQ